MKCDGKNDCDDLSDENNCDDPSIYDADFHENKNIFSMPSYLKSFSLTNYFRVNVLGAKVNNKVFKVSFSINQQLNDHSGLLSLTSAAVEIIRIPYQGQELYENDLKNGEIVRVVEFELENIKSVKDIYSVADEGYTYVCVFLVSFVKPNEEPKLKNESTIYRLNEVIHFNSKGLKVIQKQDYSSKYNQILVILSVALSFIFTTMIIVYLCIYRKRQYRQMAIQDLKESHNPKKENKKRIFKGTKIGDLKESLIVPLNN